MNKSRQRIYDEKGSSIGSSFLSHLETTFGSRNQEGVEELKVVSGIASNHRMISYGNTPQIWQDKVKTFPQVLNSDVSSEFRLTVENREIPGEVDASGNPLKRLTFVAHLGLLKTYPPKVEVEDPCGFVSTLDFDLFNQASRILDVPPEHGQDIAERLFGFDEGAQPPFKVRQPLAQNRFTVRKAFFAQHRIHRIIQSELSLDVRPCFVNPTRGMMDIILTENTKLAHHGHALWEELNYPIFYTKDFVKSLRSHDTDAVLGETALGKRMRTEIVSWKDLYEAQDQNYYVLGFVQNIPKFKHFCLFQLNIKEVALTTPRSSFVYAKDVELNGLAYKCLLDHEYKGVYQDIDLQFPGQTRLTIPEMRAMLSVKPAGRNYLPQYSSFYLFVSSSQLPYVAGIVQRKTPATQRTGVPCPIRAKFFIGNNMYIKDGNLCADAVVSKESMTHQYQSEMEPVSQIVYDFSTYGSPSSRFALTGLNSPLGSMMWYEMSNGREGPEKWSLDYARRASAMYTEETGLTLLKPKIRIASTNSAWKESVRCIRGEDNIPLQVTLAPDHNIGHHPGEEKAIYYQIDMFSIADEDVSTAILEKNKLGPFHRELYPMGRYWQLYKELRKIQLFQRKSLLTVSRGQDSYIYEYTLLPVFSQALLAKGGAMYEALGVTFAIPSFGGSIRVGPKFYRPSENPSPRARLLACFNEKKLDSYYGDRWAMSKDAPLLCPTWGQYIMTKTSPFPTSLMGVQLETMPEDRRRFLRSKFVLPPDF